MSTTILKVVSSFRGDQSASNQVSDAIIENIKAKEGEVTVTVRDVSEGLGHLDSKLFGAFITPETDRSEVQQQAVANSDEMIKEIFDADTIVIGVPMYNFTIPSVLKSWFDHIARTNITFKYTENGAVGLVEGKKVYLAIATGGVYSEEANAPFDFTENYLKSILAFIGITDVTTFRAEGMAIPDLAPKAVPEAVEKVNAFSF